MKRRNVAASVRARLLRLARERNQEFGLVLLRYALERLLYRMSVSPHADQFLLKGALLFELWFDVPHRPTRDADLLGFGSPEAPRLETVFREICSLEGNDGVTFPPSAVKAAAIREASPLRATLLRWPGDTFPPARRRRRPFRSSPGLPPRPVRRPSPHPAALLSSRSSPWKSVSPPIRVQDNRVRLTFGKIVPPSEVPTVKPRLLRRQNGVPRHPGLRRRRRREGDSGPFAHGFATQTPTESAGRPPCNNLGFTV